MSNVLKNKKIAILTANGFEQVELTEPRDALLSAGATVHIVSPETDYVQGWKHYDKADTFPVDMALDSANPGDYDGLVLPGGTVNPDQLRINDSAISFVIAFFDAGKPVAAICHCPWTLVETGAINGRKVTFWPSLKSDLQNASGTWVDEAVVVDKPRPA